MGHYYTSTVRSQSQNENLQNENQKGANRPLMGRGLIEPAESQFTNKCACQNGHEVSDVIGHDCQHAIGMSAPSRRGLTLIVLTGGIRHLPRPSSGMREEDQRQTSRAGC